ncbi:MAG TPA: helix-turn-helix transcriptional regulator [Micromonosporaceae bacterium]|nr:helix-turn-helix transcriptional regulator [Micromonosporaceae bacterium]
MAGPKHVPTLRAQWLGKLLRDRRESLNITLRDAGNHIMRDASTISRIEAGLVPARLPDVLELLNLYNVDEPTLRAGLEQLSRDVWHKDWWDGYVSTIQVGTMDLAWLESRAEKLRDFSPLVIHGLLQTRAYAEAVMRAVDPDADSADFQRWVDFRLRRQEVLERVDYTVILDEAMLLRVVGDGTIMRGQFEHLLELSHRPNIAIRVLPLSAGALSSPEGAFTLFSMPPPFPTVAQVPTEAGTIYVEMPKVERFKAAYARLEHGALDVEDSRTFLKTRLEQLA